MNIERLTKYLKNKTLSLSLGETLIIKTIGQGANGIVFEASIFDKPIAIKFLITDSKGNSKKQKLTRFLAEYFNVVTQNNLINIVRYIDYDILRFTDAEGTCEFPMIIMKKYDNSLVKNQISKNRIEFIKIFNFLLDTVEKIHEAGIIHRDIKPENILVENGNFVIADFGIAKFNPEYFGIKPETEPGERLGNRLFSAPEQSIKDVKPHATMDIFAIGQVLQWYAAGDSLRGTGRIPVSDFFENCELIDIIIEKCLEHVPKKRFQSISEIRDFIEQYLKSKQEISVWKYLDLFDLICRRNFPKNSFGFTHSNDNDRIDLFLNDLYTNQSAFERQLWWHNGSSNNYINLLPVTKGIWRISHNEYKIRQIWVNCDGHGYNNYILIHFLKDDPFIFETAKRYYTFLVDGKHHISESENQNGYAEIEGSIVDLSKHKVEIIIKQEEEGYFFIATKYDCILQRENDKMVSNFISKLNSNPNLSADIFRKFNLEINAHKHPKVLQDL